jgi:uncharacterized membrane protein
MDRPHIPDRVAALEARVAFLESALRSQARSESGKEASLRKVMPIVARPMPRAEESAAKSSWELQVGLTWLNRAGAVAVVFALVFAALWANDQGYLSPLLRTLLASGVSLAALCSGLRMSSSASRGTRVFAYGFQVIGSLGLYIVCFSAAHIDHILSPGQAMAAACLNTIALTALAHRFQLNPLANLAALGGLSVPLLLPTEQPHFALLFVFLTAQAVLHLWLARTNRWAQVALIQALGLSAYFIYLAGHAVSLGGVGQCLAMTLVLGGFVCLYLRDELFSEGASDVDRVAAWISLAGALACWSVADVDLSHMPLLLVVLGGTGLAALARLMHRHRSRPRTSGPAVMGAAIVLFAGLLAEGPMQILALASPLALLWLSLLREEDSLWVAVRALSLLAIPLLCFWLYGEVLESDGARAALFAGAMVLQLPLWWPAYKRHAHTLAVFSSHAMGAMSLGLWLGQTGTGLEVSGDWATSIVPAVYGLALLWLGRRFEDPVTRYTGLGFAALAVAKVVFVDVWFLSSGARVSVFFSLGLLLLGGSYLYSRQESA